MNGLPRHLVTLTLLLLLLQSDAPAQDRNSLRDKARRLAQEFVIVDTHIDSPYRLTGGAEDLSVRTKKGDFDYVRAREGGLDVAFMSIYTSSSTEPKGTSRKEAEALIDMVEKMAADAPTKFAVVTNTADVLAGFGKGKVLLALGMENGSPIEGSLETLRHFYRRGVRYVTLAHAKSNHICDSSYDPERRWNGLSPFGREVVAEMNRLGIMVDISHVSDSAFYQVMRISGAPAIASHSSCRHFTPGFERNMDDDMIRLLASKGGVIMINFGSTFVRQDLLKRWEEGDRMIEEHVRQKRWKKGGKEASRYEEQYWKNHPIGFANVKDVADHIEHVAKLVGVEHVGFGSDFDGVGDSLPEGLKDVSQYPNLIEELLARGFSEEDVRKICGANLLRVWQRVEELAGK
jgi:membrane dipeptidase